MNILSNVKSNYSIIFGIFIFIISNYFYLNNNINKIQISNFDNYKLFNKIATTIGSLLINNNIIKKIITFFFYKNII